MKLQEPEKGIIFITIVLALAIVVVSITFRINDWDQPETEQSGQPTSVLPADFRLGLIYGPCVDDLTTRTSVSLSHAAELTVSKITGANTAVEQSGYLSEEQQTRLLSRLESENVWAIEAVLESGEDINVWNGECSHFELQADGRSTMIDEAFGIDPDYFRIKNEIKRLAEGI